MLKKFWHKITHIGISEALEPREALRVSYVNYITLVAILYILVRTIVSLPNWSYSIKLFGMLFFVALILILNYYHFHTAAKIFAFFIWVTLVSIFSYLFLGGFYGGAFVVLFSAVPWPFMLFDIKQKNYIVLCLGYLFLLFTMLVVLQYVYPLPVNAQLNSDVVRISTTVLTILFLLLITWFFHSTSVALEEKLLKEKEKSEAANRAKSEFLANMSHELRTPLNAILGFSQLMRRDPGISPEQLANIETINRSGEHLLSLINDVLEFSKIEAGRIVVNPENFDLYRLLLGLEEMFRLRARQKELTLDVVRDNNIPQYIRADANKLRQILINLLGNAVKFTESGGITLQVTKRETNRKSQTDGCCLQFEVVDTGVGIPSEEQSKIFDAFFQTDSRRSSIQGTGLGLPISWQFVKLLGGELAVNSEAGKGTKFSFDIPVELVNGAGTESFQLTQRVIGLADGQPVFRLMVVEDNDDNRNLLVKLLQSAGFEVRDAANGQDAVKIWEEWRPHLIWMDMRMPIMDGYQATTLIKNAPGGEETVIIALTASAFEEDRLKVIEHGCNDFVRKPFRAHEIFERIIKHLGVRYVYAEEDESRKSLDPGEKMSDEILATFINDLPEEVVAKLKEATVSSDADMIDAMIEEIRSENVQLAEALTGMAGNYAYDRILALFQKAEEMTAQRQEQDIYKLSQKHI